ncbi:hypothetical protein RJZ57_006604 [Blastomyces gilchristii]
MPSRLGKETGVYQPSLEDKQAMTAMSEPQRPDQQILVRDVGIWDMLKDEHCSINSLNNTSS